MRGWILCWLLVGASVAPSPAASADEELRVLQLYRERAERPFDADPERRDAVIEGLARVVDEARAAARRPVFAAARAAWLHLVFRNHWDLDPAAPGVNATGLALLDEVLGRGRAPAEGAFAADWDGAVPSRLATAMAALALAQAYENEELVRLEDVAVAAAAALEGSSRADTPEDRLADALLATALLMLHKNSGDPARRAAADRVLARLDGVAIADDATAAQLAIARAMRARLAGEDTRPAFGFRALRPPPAAPPAFPEDVRRRLAALPDARLAALFEGVYATLVVRLPRTAGDFAWDYGDSPGYAAEVLHATGRDDLVREIAARERSLVARPTPARLTEISFGVDALAAAAGDPDPAHARPAEAAWRRAVAFGALVSSFDRHYLDRLDAWTGGGGYDYGATTLSAQVALTQLAFAARRPGEALLAGLLDPARVGARIAEACDRIAWSPELRLYRSGAGRDAAPSLLSNATLLLLLLRLHERGETGALDRAAQVASGLDALWDPVRGAYFANPAERDGGGYTSLSSNSYALLALLRLHRATGAPIHLERARAVAEFIRRDLHAGGVLHHHVHRGRPTAGDLWCPGCSWRVLAILLEWARGATPSWTAPRPDDATR
jgi:hypothetical protein